MGVRGGKKITKCQLTQNRIPKNRIVMKGVTYVIITPKEKRTGASPRGFKFQIRLSEVPFQTWQPRMLAMGYNP